MYAVDFEQIGANIQKQMERKRLTRQMLADALGISKAVMSKIIQGNKVVNVNELAKIAFFMKISTDELLLADKEPVSAESFNFMENVKDEDTLEKVNRIRLAIDEIHMLEKLLYDERIE